MAEQTRSLLQDRVVLLLTNGMSPESAEGYCLQQGVVPDDARQIVLDARHRITIAADFHRDEQLGKAISRLEDLYAKSITSKDMRTALQTQREINRLLSLYAPAGRGDEPHADEDPMDLRRQLDQISAYLLPLKLVGENYPLPEHARMAAETIRLHGYSAGHNSGLPAA